MYKMTFVTNSRSGYVLLKSNRHECFQKSYPVTSHPRAAVIELDSTGIGKGAGETSNLDHFTKQEHAKLSV